RGTVHPASLRRYGAASRWGAQWLDEPGEDHGVVRVSRSVGLPPPWPDVLGLSLRFPGSGGAMHDLLLATTGLARPTRYLLTPRRDPGAATYSCLLPYRTHAGSLVLLAARPVVRGAPRPRLVFELCIATPAGEWSPFGELTVSTEEELPDVSFDPIRNPLPGLYLPGALARLRESAYVGARAGRGARDRELVVLPAVVRGERVD
ncbi:MAG: phosphodiesterase, partial [Actinomycetota bacterium]|nr:phosphodiesterase [Actinomycetota bacterium]